MNEMTSAAAQELFYNIIHAEPEQTAATAEALQLIANFIKHDAANVSILEDVADRVKSIL